MCQRDYSLKILGLPSDFYDNCIATVCCETWKVPNVVEIMLSVTVLLIVEVAGSPCQLYSISLVTWAVALCYDWTGITAVRDVSILQFHCLDEDDDVSSFLISISRVFSSFGLSLRYCLSCFHVAVSRLGFLLMSSLDITSLLVQHCEP